MGKVERLIDELAQPGARLELVWEGEAWEVAWSAERGDASASDPLLPDALRACRDRIAELPGMVGELEGLT